MCKHEIVVAGDLNINLIGYEDSCLDIKKFVYSMFSLNFVPSITKPTRFPDGNQRGGPSLLDHMWHNRRSVTKSGIILYNITDHLPTFFILTDLPLSDNNMIKLMFRDHSEDNICIFRDRCRLFNWQFDPNVNVSCNVEHFSENLNKLYCKSFPLKIKYVSANRLKKPWLTSSIIKSIKMKSYYFKKLKLNEISATFYKRYRNMLTDTIRKAKRQYQNDSFYRCKGDLRKTWKLINDVILDTKFKKFVPIVNDNGSEISDRREIAQNFNNYFCNVANLLDSTIPAQLSDPRDNINVNLSSSLFFNPVNPFEIINIVNKLKNSSYGLYSIPTNVFKSVIDVLCLPLSVLINQSLSTGIFPDSLKKAVVVPIHKSGSESELSNYRPTSTLPLLSKIFERSVYNRLNGFLNKHDILSYSQFGFRRGRSTVDALVRFVEEIYESWNSKKHIIGVSVDLRKAFDTVNHGVLEKKLFMYGIRGLPLTWFESYLHNRTQKVRVDGVLSDEASIKLGVPQGSILGPLLFLLYKRYA